MISMIFESEVLLAAIFVDKKNFFSFMFTVFVFTYKTMSNTSYFPKFNITDISYFTSFNRSQDVHKSTYLFHPFPYTNC